MASQHFITCPLCEATCGLVVETSAGEVMTIRGDAEDPFSQGYLCPKAAALDDLRGDPDRLREPVRRTQSGWETISWATAFDEVASGIQRIQKELGPSAFGLYLGNPSVHNLGIMTTGQLFLRSVKTRNRYSATSADQLPHMLASLLMFGNQLAIPVPDIDRTDFLVIMGGNPLVSNGSLMTAPDMKGRLRALRERGGQVLVVDPRRTRTAASADQHLFIRPGTDALFLLAVLHTLFAEHRTKLGRLAPITEGVEQLRELCQRFAPEEVADTTGVPAHRIRELARAAANARSSVFYGRLGLCTQEFGGLAVWLINAVNIVTGNLDSPGGSMFATPAVDLPGAARSVGLLGRYNHRRSRVRNLPDFGGELPVSTMADEMLTAGEGQIHGFMTIAGNPVLSTPNGTKLERALAGLSFMVSVDPYINETTRHANIILPPTSALERDHYDVVLGAMMVRNIAKFSPAVFERAPSQRHDWEIFLELWKRRQASDDSAKRPPWLSVLEAGPRAVMDTALRMGPHKLTLEQVLATPHGMDLGPLQPRLPDMLATANGRIALVPTVYRDDLERLLRKTAAYASQPLRLIGRRHLHSNNSWMHNSARLVKGPERCTLLVHPSDAATYGLIDGEMASLSSTVATVEVPVELCDDIMPGVVSLPHGWGHHRKDTRLGVAAQHAGVSLNDLTDDAVVDEMSGNAVLNGIPVELAPAPRAD